MITNPVIYDFVDNHGVFQKQWLKRKAFYKKQNYKIVKTTSVEYTSDYKKWKLETTNKCSKNLNIMDDEDATDNVCLKGTCLIPVKR